MIAIREGGLDTPAVQALLALHARGMLASSPAESCHFLDLSGLKAPEIRFWSAWDADAPDAALAGDPGFAAAHALYRRFGFEPCPAFGDYPADDRFSRFFTRRIGPDAAPLSPAAALV